MKTLSESIIGRKGAPIPNFSIYNLEMGDVVILRNRRVGIINDSKSKIISYWDNDTTQVFSLCFYDKNLCYNMSGSYDIMEVWRDRTGKLPRKYNEVSNLSNILKFLRDLEHMIPKYNMEQIWKRN